MSMDDQAGSALHSLDGQAWWVVCFCAQWCGVCREFRATFDALMGEMRAEVAVHLTDAQREEHLRIMAELDQRHRDNRALMRAFPPPPASTNAGK